MGHEALTTGNSTQDRARRAGARRYKIEYWGYMEHGGAKHHRERMAESIREELTALVEGELGDPRIGLVSVNEVHLAPDGKSARILVEAEGDENEAARTLEGLSAAVPYIRRELTQRLHLRKAPELYFQLDHSVEYTARIDELLQRINKRNR